MQRLECGQRVILLTKDIFEGKLATIDLCLPTQYRVRIQGEEVPSIYVWDSEIVPITSKISRDKLKMLKHLYICEYL